jgi:hypothetical protein
VPHVAPGRCTAGDDVYVRTPMTREDMASRSEARVDVDVTSISEAHIYTWRGSTGSRPHVQHMEIGSGRRAPRVASVEDAGMH